MIERGFKVAAISRGAIQGEPGVFQVCSLWVTVFSGSAVGLAHGSHANSLSKAWAGIVSESEPFSIHSKNSLADGRGALRFAGDNGLGR